MFGSHVWGQDLPSVPYDASVTFVVGPVDAESSEQHSVEAVGTTRFVADLIARRPRGGSAGNLASRVSHQRPRWRMYVCLCRSTVHLEGLWNTTYREGLRMSRPMEQFVVHSSLHIYQILVHQRGSSTDLPSEPGAYVGDGEHGNHHRCALHPSCVAVPQMFQQGCVAKAKSLRTGRPSKGIPVGVIISRARSSLDDSICSCPWISSDAQSIISA
jgi:hypothetical protein